MALSQAQYNGAKILLDGGATAEQAAQAVNASPADITAAFPMFLPALVNSGGTGRLGTMFSNLRNPNKPLIGANLNSLKGLGADLRAKPLWEGGPSVAKSANVLSGIYQGGKALKGLYENSMKQSDYDSLKDDISLAVASNPMYDMYMDASDEKTLRKMNNDTLANNWSGVGEGALKGIPQAALAAIIGGMTGGVPGAAIGGIGSLVNSGIQGYGRKTEEATSQLQGLYDRLRQANEDYRSMKRPAGLRRAGLSSQYFNQLY